MAGTEHTATWIGCLWAGGNPGPTCAQGGMEGTVGCPWVTCFLVLQIVGVVDVVQAETL